MKNTKEENNKLFFQIKTLSEKREDIHYSRHPFIENKSEKNNRNSIPEEVKDLEVFYNAKNFQTKNFIEKKERAISVYNKNEKKRMKQFNVYI